MQYFNIDRNDYIRIASMRWRHTNAEVVSKDLLVEDIEWLIETVMKLYNTIDQLETRIDNINNLITGDE